MKRVCFWLLMGVLAFQASPAGAQTCTARNLPLVANGTTIVGNVLVVGTATSVTVTFNVTAPWVLDKVQLHKAGSLAGLPQTLGGAPRPDRFAKQASFNPGVSSYTVTLPGTQNVQSFLAAHAFVHQGASCSTGHENDGEDDEHEHESGSSTYSSVSGFSSSGDSSGDDHHHNGDDDGHCAAEDSDNDCHDSSSSISSRSATHHSSDDSHSDDDHHDGEGDDHDREHDCSCSKQSAWAGNLLFPGSNRATYFTFTISCSGGVPE